MATLDYKSAGVDKEEGYKTVSKIQDYAKKTHNSRVLAGLGSFGAFYDLSGYKNPVLISGTDGVGTKLKIAFALNKYDTVGIDAVAMCVNDILCHGAKPQFFLDYLACGKLDSDVAADIVKGISQGCLQADCALIGGETAEMPDFYQLGEYDIAGFAVGVVEKENIIDGSKVAEGDVLIGLASSGFHSNGYSLLRKIFTDFKQPTEDGRSVGEILLTPTKIYVKPVLKILEKYPVSGLAHITGGGIIENLPRAFSSDLAAEIDKSALPQLPLMKQILEKVPEDECLGTFNMGVGFILIVKAEHSKEIINDLNNLHEKAFLLGKIVKKTKENSSILLLHS